MQTFLPYANFERSAEVLDNRRLGKQRVETLQIVRALTVPGYAWKSHPAVLMWTGYEEALASYGLTICGEWCRRGFADTCAIKICDDARSAEVLGVLRPAGREQHARTVGDSRYGKVAGSARSSRSNAAPRPTRPSVRRPR